MLLKCNMLLTSATGQTVKKKPWYHTYTVATSDYYGITVNVKTEVTVTHTLGQQTDSVLSNIHLKFSNIR